MKFYREKEISSYYFGKIKNNKFNAIYSKSEYIQFFKNGIYHNTKNADYIHNDGYKEFSLNGKFYGNQDKFTKESWRKFSKLQAFL
jgi:hypothetical protein